MKLKGKEWFYKKCLLEVEQHGRFSHLCWDILQKGIGQTNSTRGHATQAIGACQVFLNKHKKLIQVVKAADPTFPFDVSSNSIVSKALKKWLATCNGAFGKGAFGYDYDTLKKILTPTLGGTLTGGGGGNDEFKRVLRLMAEFIE
jgi:hypothetical protein